VTATKTDGTTPTKGDDLQPLVVRMPATLLAELKTRSETEDRTMAQTVRRAVTRYLATEPD
jgi:hypothetical protein